MTVHTVVPRVFLDKSDNDASVADGSGNEWRKPSRASKRSTIARSAALETDESG